MPSGRTWIIHHSQSKKAFMRECHGSVMCPSCASSSQSVYEAVFSGNNSLRALSTTIFGKVGYVAPLTLAWYNLLVPRPPVGNVYLGAALFTTLSLLLEAINKGVRPVPSPIFRVRSLAIFNLWGFLWMASTNKIHSPVSGPLAR
jgi:hypothetical protein